MSRNVGMWTTFTQLALVAHSHGRTLLVAVDCSALSVQALETIEPPGDIHGAQAAKLAQQIFDDHAHDVVCPKARSLPDAIEKAEAYARQWQRGARARARARAQCECSEIRTGKPKENAA